MQTDDRPLAVGGADARWLAFVMQLTYCLLLGSAMIRFLLRHSDENRAPWVIALAVALTALYFLGPRAGRGATPWSPVRLAAWFGGIIALWAPLVLLAPSFGWVAVPLFFTALRTLPPRAAYGLIAVLTAFVIGAQLQLSARFDIDLVVGPMALSASATALFIYMQRQAARQETLITDLVRTRRELAATERREGTLAERQRLAMEIHDTLAQGVSSQQMLLRAAQRLWEADPGKARGHVDTAVSIGEHNLSEARRFVHDLAPTDLAGGGGLAAALYTLAERESGERLSVRVHVDEAGHGPLPELPELVQSALLRIAQGALANVREHAGATTAVLTLTCLDDQVVLDVADDGRGFDAAALPEGPDGMRGHGVPAIRARLKQLGGRLTIESSPGEGTVVSAAVPLERREG
ncbi:sensor histidine kinase [Streptomyces sp. A7024]|uniref:Oxygen sensor histidine kinase NreB n=1 Tax=Streptomyces coryli TaxID=1128680 RepID=A0A6G4TS56_9ACTN|nr:sensor histidine kinase [Streptomyces coryli]NGN62825.1 sensor histidine kinase [Streptomyces coryli]